jgi:transposase-like protein
MKVPKHIIVAAISLYFDGLSVRKCQKQLEKLLGEKVDGATIWRWLQKYSKLVSEYTSTLTPQLSGKWHEDETMIKCEGRDQWFWEMIDEDTRFLVASHLSGTRDIVETIKMFEKAQNVAKQRPRAIFVDGSHTYDRAFNKVYYTRYKVNRVELVKRVGIKARETNNIVERLHGTLKDRLKPMRGLKTTKTAQTLLDGYVINYNYVREHQSIGKTPAQAANITIENGWSELIEKAIATQAKPQDQVKTEPIVQVVRVK